MTKDQRAKYMKRWNVLNREHRKTYDSAHCKSYYEKNPIYSNYRAMRARCNLKTHRSYEDYGGKGITVCSQWEGNYKQFEHDMLPTYIEGYHLHRITDGDYTPTNCEWMSPTDHKRLHQSKKDGNNV